MVTEASEATPEIIFSTLRKAAANLHLERELAQIAQEFSLLVAGPPDQAGRIITLTQLGTREVFRVWVPFT